MQTNKPKAVMVEIREYQGEGSGRYKTIATFRLYNTSGEEVRKMIARTIKANDTAGKIARIIKQVKQIQRKKAS